MSTPHTAALLDDLRVAFATNRSHLDALKAQLLVEARRGGIAQVRRTFPHWWDVYVADPRRREYWRVARAAAARRLEQLTQELTRRYPTRQFPVSPASALLALHRTFTHARHSQGRAWRLTDPVWPTDVWVRHKLFATLDDWARRARVHAFTLAAAAGSAGFGPTLQPHLAKGHAKIAYPFGDATDVDEVDLIDHALDDVVVARGEYYAAVGVRDLAREVDLLTSQTESGRVPMIVGWQWTLSDAHDQAKSSPDECDDYATADVGHPYGVGIYFDTLFVESHPNCWCSMEAVWADESDLDDPSWHPPVPDDDYESRVRALVPHDMLASRAA